MAKNEQVLALLQRSGTSLSLNEIHKKSLLDVSTRTLRRWLMCWVEQGKLVVSGHTKNRRYAYARLSQNTHPKYVGFIKPLDNDLQALLLDQVRDLWTFSATGSKGNKLSLQDCHLLLCEGLTVANKPITDHESVVGFSHAIDALYLLLDQPITKAKVLNLYALLQQGDAMTWGLRSMPKNQYHIDNDQEQCLVEYAKVEHIAQLLGDWIYAVNQITQVGVGVNYSDPINQRSAAKVYAKLHLAFVHIHPLTNKNEIMARLLANIPLLKSGFPPLIISSGSQREYLQLIYTYQESCGQISGSHGLWPNTALLSPFIDFCQQQYACSLKMVDNVLMSQQHRRYPHTEAVATYD